MMSLIKINIIGILLVQFLSLLPAFAVAAIRPGNRIDEGNKLAKQSGEQNKIPKIKVLLEKGLEELIISGRDILFKDNRTKRESNLQGSKVKFNCNTSASAQTGKVLFASLSSPAGIIKINDLHYRGDVAILADYTNNKCEVVNELPMEDYIASVLPREMNKSWPLEALKAQAVAARSYALYKIKGAQKRDELYHLESSEKHQVSGNLKDMDEVTRRAAKETLGEVLTDLRGEPVPVFFHAACGGRTWVPHQVWSNPVDGYSSRPCICHHRPDQGWKRTIDWKELLGFLKWNKDKQNIYFDEIKTVTSGNVKTGPDDSRYPTLNLFYKEKGASITKSMFRRFFGRDKIPSNNFKVTMNQRGLALEGKGRGHGVGMCQLGALDFARKGWSYKKILQHYFPGHELTKVY
jgi:stage II sporulation protein D